MNLALIGKYDRGEEGTRYAWSLDGEGMPYVESGAFRRRTKLGKGTSDEKIAAYTISVSRGCILTANNLQCHFCITGNVIPFKRLLNAREIAFQNVYLALDDEEGNKNKKLREFAYMGQGEPGLNYQEVKKAIIGTDLIMQKLKIRTFRHIFATCGIPKTIRQLGQDIKNGDYGDLSILLHLSVHADLKKRKEIMPINNLYPLKEVIDSTHDYYKDTGLQVSVNFMLFKNAVLKGRKPFSNITVTTMNNLLEILNPEIHRIVLCEYNQDSRIGKNEEITLKEIGLLEELLKKRKFSYKRFVAFGKEDKLACGLLGGEAEPNIDQEVIKPIFKKAKELVSQYIK